MEDLLKASIAQVDEEKAVKLVRNLVDIPSNTGEERDCAEFLVAHMEKIGLQARLQEITDRRANAIGMIGPVVVRRGRKTQRRRPGGSRQNVRDSRFRHLRQES